MTLPSLGEHELLAFWVQLLVVVVAARLLGQLFRRIKQPAVVGELAAGMLLGPSVLGVVAPGAFGFLFPNEEAQAAMLTTVGWLGVAFLLILTGFETDLAIIRRLGRAAALVSVGALVVPFALGLGVGALLPEAEFLGDDSNRLVFVLFMATALSISSLPVIARILGELGLMRRNFGQVTVAVGMANDVVGWLVLGVVAGIAREGGFRAGPFAITVVAMVFLLVFALTAGQRITDAALRRTRARSDSPTDALAVTLVIALAAGAFAQAAHIEAVLGIFIAGVVLGRSRFQHPAVVHHLEGITQSLLAPVFFAGAGLRLDLRALADPTVLAWSGVILAAAVVSKFVGSYVGARAAHMTSREGLALGVGLNARGAVEVVIATVGLSVGALNQAAYTAIVVMAIVTSMMAPPLLRLVVRGWRGTAEEQERLEREETLDRNLLVRTGRLLLPSRGEPNSVVAAQVLQLAWPKEAGVTVLTVNDELEVEPICSALAGRDVEVRVVADGDRIDEILREARLGYDAVVIGIDPDAHAGRTVSAVAEALLVRTQVPVVMVRKAKGARRTPGAFTRAIVPVSGTAASRRAQEVAFHMSRELGTEIVLTHVVERPGLGETGDQLVTVGAGSAVTEGLLGHAEALASDLGARVHTSIRSGESTATELLAEATAKEADLMVMGASVRRADGHAFLGHIVEEVLDRAEATVVVIATPAA